MTKSNKKLLNTRDSLELKSPTKGILKNFVSPLNRNQLLGNICKIILEEEIRAERLEKEFGIPNKLKK